MSQRNRYSLRSQCRSHGSCNCGSTPDLPSSARKSPRTARNNSNSSSNITSSELNTSNLSSELSSFADFESESPNRYSSSSSSKNNCSIVSSHSYVSSFSTLNASIVQDSDYNTNSSSDSSFVLTSISERKLRGILVNSERSSNSKSNSGSNGSPRNVTFEIASSTPLTSDQDNKLHEFEDTRSVGVSEMSQRSSYSLRSQYRSNGSSSYRNTPDLPNSTRKSPRRNNSNNSSNITSIKKGPLFLWNQIRRLFGLLYWLLLQTLISEKWVLEWRGERSGNYRGGSERKSWFKSLVAKYFSWSQTNATVSARGGSSGSKSEEYFSDDDGEGSYNTMTNMNGNSGTAGKPFYNYNNINGHDYAQTVTPKTTSQVRGGVDLIQNEKTKYFGSWSNQNKSQINSEDIVDVSKLGSIAGWGKNLLVFWKSNKEQSIADELNEFMSDDESESEDEAIVGVDVTSSSSGLAFVGRICKFLTKLLLLLLALLALAYFVYSLWPLMIGIVSKTWEASKDFIYSFGENFSTLCAIPMKVVPGFISSLPSFSFLTTTLTPVDSPKPACPVNPETAPIASSAIPLTIPMPPSISKEEFEALQERINELEAKLALNEGKLSLQNDVHQKEITDMRERYNSHREDMEGIQTSISTSMVGEIDKQVKISCEKNCPEAMPVAPEIKDSFDPTNVQVLIDKAIQKYDADKTGRPDLALESSGGSILNTRCTKSSKLRNSVVSFWGLKIWSPPNNPRTIIQPGVVPGECWAFEGSVGDVVIKLVSPAVLTGFTMEHISKLVSPYGNIDSAPYKFQVLGLNDVNDWDQAHEYGTFSYEDNGSTLQYFDVTNHTSNAYPIVELKILSNHGNLHHTCLYRFRVHGNLVNHFN